jgi:large subunit ribosomal protein L32
MAVPKKRTGHSAQGHRRSNWKATKPETTKCPNCGATVLTHTVCTACGTYKGQPVSLKDRKEVTVKEEKKPAKKSTKKAETAEETTEKKTKKSAAKTEKKAETAKEAKAEKAVEAKKEEKTEE